MAWAPGKPLRLGSDNYVLRSMRPFQINEEVFGWLTDVELMDYSGFPVFRSRKEVERWMKRFDNRHDWLLSMTCRKTDQIIGIQKVEYWPHSMGAKADVVIGNKDYWGSGAALETRKKIIDFAFYRLRVHKVHGTVMSRNPSGIFNYKALGFRCEGVLKEHTRSAKGEFCDMLMFGLLRDEWDEIRKRDDR